MEVPSFQVRTAQDLYEEEKTRYLTTGCASIDRCLKGGIIRGSITEVTVYGESNELTDYGRGFCGEDTIGDSDCDSCLFGVSLTRQSLLSEEKHGCNGKALYVYSDPSFPYARLQDEAASLSVNAIPTIIILRRSIPNCRLQI